MADSAVASLIELPVPLNGDDFLIEDNTANVTKKIGYDNLKAALNADLSFQASLGFTPEDVANKEASALDTSTTKYPNNAVVKSAVDAKANLAGGNSFTGSQTFGDGVIERFSGQVEGLPGTSKTLAATDNGKVVRTTGGAGTTITIPNTLTIGFNLMVVRDGTGEVQFVTSGGMNLRHPDNHTRARLRYSAISLLVVASNECILMGDSKA
jgi:hypothetical protein